MAVRTICATPRISIHAPRTGSDVDVAGRRYGIKVFQSTLPARGATLRGFPALPAPEISIHAPRTGSDVDVVHLAEKFPVFQSTLPARGATSDGARRCRRCSGFQSTLPARGATYRLSHAPRRPWHFNPRSPHGERHCPPPHSIRIGKISIHAPRTGSDAHRHPP